MTSSLRDSLLKLVIKFNVWSVQLTKAKFIFIQIPIWLLSRQSLSKYTFIFGRFINLKKSKVKSRNVLVSKLTKLKDAFEINSKTATACLPSQNQSVPSDAPCYLAAWGWKRKGGRWSGSTNGHTHWRRLRETDLPILSDQECKALGFLNFRNSTIEKS